MILAASLIAVMVTYGALVHGFYRKDRADLIASWKSREVDLVNELLIASNRATAERDSLTKRKGELAIALANERAELKQVLKVIDALNVHNERTFWLPDVEGNKADLFDIIGTEQPIGLPLSFDREREPIGASVAADQPHLGLLAPVVGGKPTWVSESFGDGSGACNSETGGGLRS